MSNDNNHHHHHHHHHHRHQSPHPSTVGFSVPASSLSPAFPQPDISRGSPFPPSPRPPSAPPAGPGPGGFVIPSAAGYPSIPPEDNSGTRAIAHSTQQGFALPVPVPQRKRSHDHAHRSHSHSPRVSYSYTHTHHAHHSGHAARPSHSSNPSGTYLTVPTRPPQPSHHTSPQIPARPSHSHRPSGAPHRVSPAYRMPPSQIQQYGPSVQEANQPHVRSFFQYSQCTGKKKALCIGINYRGQSNALKGCVNDAKSVRDFLIRRYGYKEEDIVLLTDDGRSSRDLPTRKNMIDAMKWLVQGARQHDSLFFHYSGHGGQTRDLDGDEDDGFDEVIYPLDYKTKGHIVDDDMFRIMVKPLPVGCRLTALFDSCHSGTALDLPYIYSSSGKLRKEPNLALTAGHGLLGAATAYSHHDVDGMINAFGGLMKKNGGKRAERIRKASRTSAADVISWSGCKDSQTSADTTEAGKATGAMSYAFMSSLKHNPRQSYQELLQSVREILRRRYSQKPQLSSSHPIDTSVLFLA